MGNATFKDLFSSSIEGVKQANKVYKKMSGFGLWHAPESFIQTEIALSLSKICPFVTLEDTVDGILHDAGSEIRGRRPRASGSGRIDIVVWKNNDTPRALLEVKKGRGNQVIIDDAVRIHQLLKKGGSLTMGFIVLYTDAMKAITINNRFKKNAENSKTEIVESAGPIKVTGDETWYWGAACFRVK